MEKKQIYIIATSIISFFILSILIVVFYYQYEIKNIHKEYKDKENEYIIENTISRNFFEDTFKLTDYSAVEYKLEETAHKIIDGIREKHYSPILVTRASRDLELCAGFIWLLSEELWWKNIPYYIGMLEQVNRTPATAWELPTAYRYFWGKTLSDFSWEFDPYKKDLWEKIELSQIQWFFVDAFSEKALFWDIWFLYSSTKYIQSIVQTWNYNSHITKNMWISPFNRTIESVENLTHKEIISQTLQCKSEISDTIYPLLENYKFTLDNKQIVLYNQEFHYINEQGIKLNKVEFKKLDQITFKDITLAHFFHWTSHVDSLFEMTCKWEFLPINVIALNPRLIEKK